MPIATARRGLAISLPRTLGFIVALAGRRVRTRKKRTSGTGNSSSSWKCLTVDAPPRSMSLEDLPLECQRNVLERLHWRDVCAVSSCSRALREVANDEHDWERRCARRFTAAELDRVSNATSTSASADQTWRGRFSRAVARARDGARAAAPLLAVPDNQRLHFRQFERALEHLKGMSLGCFREFVACDASSSTLLLLAGLTECLARAPAATPEQVSDVLSEGGGGTGERKARLQLWVLGRLDGSAPFRLRDDTAVHEGTLLSLVRDDREVWEIMLRGIKHEVRDMEVESVGPKKKTFWDHV